MVIRRWLCTLPWSLSSSSHLWGRVSGCQLVSSHPLLSLLCHIYRCVRSMTPLERISWPSSLSVFTNTSLAHNYVLPLPLHVPLEGTCLLIIPGDYSLHHVASAPEAAVGEAGRVRTRRLSCKRCDRTSPGLGTVQAFELSCSGAMEHEGHEMCWDA